MRWNSAWRKSYFARRKANKKNSSRLPLIFASTAARLAEGITSEDNQRLRFEMRGQGPANIQAANSPQVQASPAIAALLAQSEFSHLQRVGGKFWDPVSEFDGNLAEGNPSGTPLQTQLDRLADSVTAR